MLKDRAPTQSELEFVCIDELVPADHLLRKIEKTIDFGFIHDLVKDLRQPHGCFFLRDQHHRG